jgi:tetratricopeptide (TPR) repeat protein
VYERKNLFGADVRVVDTQTGSDTPLGRLEYNNLIQLEDAVANGVAKNVVDRLTETERQAAAKRLPSNLGAYQNFEAAYLLWRRREDGSNYLRKAIELDASFAPAYVLLANIRATGGVKDSPAAKEAEQLLQKAFDLDDNSADAYAVQGFIRIFHYHDWDGAERSLKNAEELDGNNINAHHWLGVLYSIHRRLDEAEAEMQKALDLDPTNPTLLADMGQLYYFAGKTEMAREYINKALAADPDHVQARQYLSALDALPDANNKERELKQLIATEDTNFVLPYINVDPYYDELRTDGRFQNILRRMNLDN